ncbi:MAG: putative K(+)-stimulated pyrophosphate-energized sodium pump [bacterium]|nr:putative K(+)-stimulated pyrophosphate-energized sodium pump [bacterium]
MVIPPTPWLVLAAATTGINMTPVYISIGAALLALLYAFITTQQLARRDPGTERMQEIGGYIAEGAMAFLQKEYQVLGVFVVVVAVLLGAANMAAGTVLIALSFIVGAFCSALAGFFGMKVATMANFRTTAAARTSIVQALDVAFKGGSVMGMSVVGLGLLGLAVLFLLYVTMFGQTEDILANKILVILSGFSMGASSIALFARVGGGIYTKAADVGADLVGKVEAGIPEDDPRNPAVIADAVGDNVGDVAGMGADLFESYVGAIISAMILAIPFAASKGQAVEADWGDFVTLPLMLAGVGIIVSIASTFLVKTKEGGNPQQALNLGIFGAVGIMTVASWFIINSMVGGAVGTGLFITMVIGLVAGTLIALATEYYTAGEKAPVMSIATASTTGSATNIISGLGVGMQSTAIPMILIAAAVLLAYHFGELYGIAIAGLGMLATVGIQLAVDAYGPIADNAGGIAEMSHLPKEVRERTDKLDSVGNTTAAIGKGFAIGSAALTALALFSAFQQQAKLDALNVLDAPVMAGLIVGAMIPFVFSSLAMKAVGDAAQEMILEVRRQFAEIPGLKEGAEGAKADYASCVAISTAASIKKMVAPGLLAVLVPVVIGFGLGKEVLGGLLAGVTVSGVSMALFMSNAGGAWDNAKKSIEAGHHGGKGSDAHKAAVVGDTVGDPFKDTAGPALNILIKLMAVVSVVIAPLLAK